jgi:hypothetical protein
MTTHHRVLHHRHGAEQREVLERAADAHRRDPVHRHVGEGLAVEQDPSGAGLIEPRQAVEQRRLARAVGPDQAADLTFSDVEGHAVEGHDAAEPYRDALDGQQRGLVS